MLQAAQFTLDLEHSMDVSVIDFIVIYGFVFVILIVICVVPLLWKFIEHATPILKELRKNQQPLWKALGCPELSTNAVTSYSAPGGLLSFLRFCLWLIRGAEGLEEAEGLECARAKKSAPEARKFLRTSLISLLFALLLASFLLFLFACFSK